MTYTYHLTQPTTRKYDLVSNLPVARFWYKGHHTHPVRRTVLVIESTREYLRGYELREGNVVRNTLGKAPVKTYRRNRIARGRQLRVDSPIRKMSAEKSTLQRTNLLNLLEVGL